MNPLLTKEYEDAQFEEVLIDNPHGKDPTGRNVSEFKTMPNPFPRRFANAEDWPNKPVKTFQDP